jgi:hypothetical protein
LGKPVAVIAVQLFLRIASAPMQRTVEADARALVMAQVRHIKTVVVLAAGDQLFDFPVQQLIW